MGCLWMQGVHLTGLGGFLSKGLKKKPNGKDGENDYKLKQSSACLPFCAAEAWNGTLTKHRVVVEQVNAGGGGGRDSHR